MFMKYLADEMYADAMVNSVDEECDEEADCKQKKVHFNGKTNFLPSIFPKISLETNIFRQK